MFLHLLHFLLTLCHALTSPALSLQGFSEISSETAQLSNQAISLPNIFRFFLLHAHLVVQTFRGLEDGCLKDLIANEALEILRN